MTAATPITLSTQRPATFPGCLIDQWLVQTVIFLASAPNLPDVGRIFQDRADALASE
jgi:hypothetical protein